MRAAGEVHGNVYQGNHYEFHGFRELKFLGIVESPPNFERDWVERAVDQSRLEAHLKSYAVTEIVASGGFGKSSLAAWACERLRVPLGFKKLLSLKVGELPAATIADLSQLSPEQLDELGMSLFGFGTIADLQQWLRGR
jgi:Domain of unknown function (DUF4351)